MEIIGIASGLVSAVVDVAAFFRTEMRRRQKQRATQRLMAAVAVGLSAAALIRLLTRHP